MIISASRRTDIPAFYSDWLIERIKERCVHVKNPFNPDQISKISLEPNDVDCIVFWSKNPKPMLDKLEFLNEYTYYFQFTINPYNSDIERNLPPKSEIIETFKKLSDKISAQKVIWRYDPVLLNAKYTVQYHIEKFNEMAYQLKGYTEKIIFSYIDFYKKIAENLKANGITEATTEQKLILAENFSISAKENNLSIATCAENIDLSQYNIKHAKCIDDELIAKLTGHDLSIKKDKNQRLECGCVASRDIGEYNTCLNGCIYCYAGSFAAGAV
ncbi:MAG: DUF1848 domain-containing protein [Treponema sp.]|nr:DUF1848 domain-containing protein [Treponema sp.]